MIRSPRPHFIGDLRDSLKIVHLPVRQEPIVILTDLLLYFCTWQKLQFKLDLYTSGSRPANMHVRSIIIHVNLYQGEIPFIYPLSKPMISPLDMLSSRVVGGILSKVDGALIITVQWELFLLHS